MGTDVTQADGQLQIEVVRAWPDRVWQRQFSIAAGSSVLQALQISGLLDEFPELRAQMPAIGIFGRQVALHETLAEGDRIELYRPLSFDPKESRRRRAAHRLAERQAGKAARRALRVPGAEVRS